MKLVKDDISYLLIENGEVSIHYASLESLKHELVHLRLGKKDKLYKGIYDYFVSDYYTKETFYEIFLLVTDYFVYKHENKLEEYSEMISEIPLRSKFGKVLKKLVKEGSKIPLRKFEFKELRKALMFASEFDSIELEFRGNKVYIERKRYHE